MYRIARPFRLPCRIFFPDVQQDAKVEEGGAGAVAGMNIYAMLACSILRRMWKDKRCRRSFFVLQARP